MFCETLFGRLVNVHSINQAKGGVNEPLGLVELGGCGLTVIFGKLSNGAFCFFFVGLTLALARLVFGFFLLDGTRITSIKKIGKKV